MGRGTYAGEIFSFSGILKILEIVLGFITVILHRYGDNGKLIFFGSSAIQLQPVSCLKSPSGAVVHTYIDTLNIKLTIFRRMTELMQKIWEMARWSLFC